MDKKQLKNIDLLKPFLRGPLPLTPDNFTPVARTPWGGIYIASHLKKDICPEKLGHIVGESWDFSCEPSFPSKILGSKVTLNELIQSFPEELLSLAYLETKGKNCEILVKILNAAEDLSLQVHPSDDDPYLKAEECGKFESWYVLHAEEKSGIYLGFKEGVRKEQFEEALKKGGDSIRPLLNFVAVKAGDYFEIPYGTCHAIGKGLVVIEPQHVLASKKGKTYRIHDWGRRYNAEGSLDPKGNSRELHIEEALRLIDPEKQSGEEFLNKLRGAVQVQTLAEGLRIETFGKNDFYKFHRVGMRKQQTLSLKLEGAFAAMIPVEGSFAIRTHEGLDSYWQKGQPGFLSAASFPLRFKAFEDSVLFLISPEGVRESWHLTEA